MDANTISIGGKNYTVLNTKEKITIADSFVVRANKIGSGNGEAKLYVGNTNDDNDDFFGQDFDSIDCIILKSDLVKYLNEMKPEYESPEQPYLHAHDLKSKWYERQQSVTHLPDVTHFSLHRQDQIAGPRIYVKSSEDVYELIRELSLPNITYLAILKLQSDDGAIVYYVKLFADFFGEALHPFVEKKQEATIVDDQTIPETEKSLYRTARIGQGQYRKGLLERCPFCPITMITDERILIASHIKPWAVSDNIEKVDAKNGIMFTPTFDYLFDRGFISFTDDKEIMLSPFLSNITFGKLNLRPGVKYPRLPIEESLDYLKYHRENIYKGIG